MLFTQTFSGFALDHGTIARLQFAIRERNTVVIERQNFALMFRLRPVLRGAAEADVQQRHSEPAAVVAGAAGDQVEEAVNAANHLHGRDDQDAPGGLGDDGAGAVQSAE